MRIRYTYTKKMKVTTNELRAAKNLTMIFAYVDPFSLFDICNKLSAEYEAEQTSTSFSQQSTSFLHSFAFPLCYSAHAATSSTSWSSCILTWISTFSNRPSSSFRNSSSQKLYVHASSLCWCAARRSTISSSTDSCSRRMIWSFYAVRQRHETRICETREWRRSRWTSSEQSDFWCILMIQRASLSRRSRVRAISLILMKLLWISEPSNSKPLLLLLRRHHDSTSKANHNSFSRV